MRLPCLRHQAWSHGTVLAFSSQYRDHGPPTFPQAGCVMADRPTRPCLRRLWGKGPRGETARPMASVLAKILTFLLS